MTRSSGFMPASCQTVIAEMTNDSSITSDARPPDTDFGSRRPIVALTRKPANGSSGISASIEEVTTSPLQRGEGIGVERFPAAEERNHERQAHGGLGGRNRHDEERD